MERRVSEKTGHSKLRELPAVHVILERLSEAARRFPRELVVAEIRRALDQARAELLANPSLEPAPVEQKVERALARLVAPSLRRVINATGVILHTNLGRAPLAAFAPLPGYSNLEYDLKTGRRGKRDVHAAKLLEQLLGSPAIVVNNNAAAVYLALNELAAGGEVLVSRGELIEIGDGFRIPDIMTRSGAVIREVGTTNRTRVDDYRNAFTERTRLILRVHPSNFRIQGFTARPELPELASLARELGVPLYEDLGSGCVVDLRPYGIEEPLASDALRDGADLISFSGDKLLGGPQAGILAGKPELVTRLRRNPMFRALRVDKLIYQTLETTLRHLLLDRREAIPSLAMIAQSPDRIRERAENLVRQLPGVRAELAEGQSVLGGGSTPEQSFPTWLISFTVEDVVAREEALRRADPPVIARIENDRLVLDLRTVFPEEEKELVSVLQETLS